MEEIILRLILGEDYTRFITEAVRYLKEDEKCKITDTPDIIKAMSIAILLIGFTKKPVNLEEYEIKLRKRKIKVNTNDFCSVFKDYIEKVEEVKFNMVKDIT